MWRLDNPLGCDWNVGRSAHQGTPEPLRGFKNSSLPAVSLAEDHAREL
jgi:hypothetical protein